MDRADRFSMLIASFRPALSLEFKPRTLVTNLKPWDGHSGTAFQHKKGQPRWTDYDALASWVVNWLVWEPGESMADIRAREESLKADKLGILVWHLLRERAKPLRKTDFDYVRLFGNEFHLSIWPAHGKGLPKATPNEVVLQ
jgi:hypothetical protein